MSTLGVTAVTFKTTEPGSHFNFQLVATPIAASNSSQLATVSNPSTGCGFATLGTGTYAQTLCFADFTPWNTQTSATNVNNCSPKQNNSFSTPLPMSAAVSGSPFTLDFCMSVSSAYNQSCNEFANCNGQAITGQTSAGAACGVAARSGYDDITASPLPTYACPPNSEAFLGNNGFYTGVPGDPALYEVDEGSTATINLTNITLLNSNGSAATNWQLVTGDAESTDPGEAITWSTDNALIPLSLLANSPTSDVGNACNSTPPGYVSTSPGLTGVGTSTVECTTNNSTDKTGTAMLDRADAFVFDRDPLWDRPSGDVRRGPAGDERTVTRMTGAPAGEDRRRSEVGDTLVEILIALAVIGIAGTAILLAFATSISGSGEHRNLVTLDTMLRTASAEVTSTIQQQPNSTFTSCSGAYQVNQQGITLPNPNAPGTNPYSATILDAQYWNATTDAFTAPPATPPQSCATGVTGGGPQLLTVQVSFHGSSGTTSSRITTVVDDPTPPAAASNCGTPTQLVWVGEPGNGNAGTALFPAPTVVLEDASGCVEQNDASTVTLSVSSGPGTVNDCVSNLGYGETTFQDCTIGTPGTYTLTAHDAHWGITSLASNQFTITQGFPVKLVFGTQPGNGTGGSPLSTQPVVWIEDNSGNVVSGDNSTVTLAIKSNPGNGTLSGCSDTTVNGVATFTGCKIDKVGTGYTLTATDAADNLTTASAPSTPFNITPGPAAQLAFTASPGTTLIGSPLSPQPVVAVEDAGGNVTTINMGTVSLGIGTNPGGGTLSGCSQSTSGGTVTFSGCSINKAGNGYTLVATDGSLPSATSTAFNVVKASPTISTTLSASSITVGASVHDSSTLSGVAGSTGSGTVAYSYYTNNTCTTGQVAVGTVTVPVSGVVPNSPAATFNSAGTFYWQAVYSGDANNNGASSPCTAANNEQLTVKYSPDHQHDLVIELDHGRHHGERHLGAERAGSSTGSGTVAYSYYTNNTCTTGQVAVGTVTVPVSGVVPNSPSSTFNSAGTFYWRAVYSGDANNNGASSPCTAGTNEQLTVTKASPTIATTLSSSSIAAGTTANDTSALSGAGGSTGSGTVAYSYYTNSTCTTGHVAAGTVTVPVSGIVPNSNVITFNSVGTFYWQAVYSGDANNNGASSPCTAGTNEQLTVTKASPTIATTLSSSSIAAGTTANDTSALSGAGGSTGSGTVAYSYYTNSTCTTGQVAAGTVTVPVSGIVPNSNVITFNSVGTFYWQAVYSGDTNNNGASSPCTAVSNEQLTVTKASPTIATTLSATSISLGASAHDTSAFTGLVNSTGSGTVAYSYYTNNTCTTGQVAVGTVTVPVSGVVPNSPAATFNSAGTFYWQAVYSGDTNNNGASSPCTAGTNEQLTVTKASPTIATTLSSSSITAGTTANDTSAFTGLVNSTGSGTVAYSYYTNNTCTTGQVAVGTVTVPVSGVVPNSPAATFNSAGTFYWRAVYSGDANNNGASSPCTAGTNEQLTVTKASPTIATTLSSSSIAAGTTANDTSALSGAGGSTGSGTVAYSYYTNSTCTTGHVAAGTVTVPVSGIVPNSNVITFNSVGTFYWQAVYSGDANNNGASSPCTAGTNEQLTVTKASPTIATTLSSSSIAAGTTANDTSALSGAGGSTGSGTVAYSYYTNSTCTTGQVAAGTVTVPVSGIVPNSNVITFNSVGTFYWQAVYSGDTNNNGASSPCTAVSNEQLTVTKASPTIATTLSSSSITAGTTANDTSALSGAGSSTGSGTVAYSYYTNNTCTTGQVAAGTVTVPVSGIVPNSPAATFNSAGTFYWQAVYSGDTNNNGASSPCTAGTNEQLTVTKASPTIATTLSSSSITAGTTANDTSAFTGLVNSTGSGTVAYSYYTNNTCTTGQVAVGTVTVPVSGVVPNSPAATFNSAGTFYWRAVYSGDANNNGASSPCTAGTNEQLTVTKASPTIATTLSSSSIAAGTTANDTSALSGAGGSTGSGTVAYSYYTNSTCTTGHVAAGTVTVPVSGIVPNSNVITFNSVGTFYWQAVYSGDANNNGASSPCTAGTNEQLTVTKASPTIATTLSSSSIAAGTTANDTSALSGAGGSTGSGTVAYSYYTNSTCTTGQVAAGTVTVPVSGIVPNSNVITFNSVGTFYWQAVYSGDTNNNGASSPCTAVSNEQLTVTKASPTIATTLSATSITPAPRPTTPRR